MAKHSEYVFNVGDIRKVIEGVADDKTLSIKINFDRLQADSPKVFRAEITATAVEYDADGKEIPITPLAKAAPGCPNPPSC
ncbi:hypothetical protein Q0590_29835 [Rhodocytophaga aerolata]|uniref:Uncharacterized protein n=1 Tax=Rhodocytophaga aerolata TaxID=455078 RepID=A0ABT8REW1_9BACT|nr:hypothetical protein [Rhodocytophaga aerolata]MDO1450514.1 hypothetical protein [Rhodocytophaga aerolata]